MHCRARRHPSLADHLIKIFANRTTID